MMLQTVLGVVGIVLLMLCLLLVIKRPSFFPANQRESVQMSISQERLNSYILPNNRGRSIDKVVCTFLEQGVNPEFHVLKDEGQNEEKMV